MMLRYVYGQDEIVASFVAQMIPHVRERGFGRCKAIGIIDDEGTLIAGIVYHNYSPEAAVIEISAAALPKSKWLTRETIRRVYEFPFDQCRCQMIVSVVPAEDERLLGQLAACGHSLVKIPRLLGRDNDAVLCLLTSEDWASNRFNNHKPIEMKEAA